MIAKNEQDTLLVMLRACFKEKDLSLQRNSSRLIKLCKRVQFQQPYWMCLCVTDRVGIWNCGFFKKILEVRDRNNNKLHPCQRRDLNPGHIGGRRVLSLLRYRCFFRTPQALYPSNYGDFSYKVDVMTFAYSFETSVNGTNSSFQYCTLFSLLWKYEAVTQSSSSSFPSWEGALCDKTKTAV